MRPVSRSATTPKKVDIDPVIAFLRCRTPDAWVLQAVDRIDEVLHDHASLELKAAQQAQRLISRYGAARTRAGRILSDRFRSTLINRLSRLAREELRHFEQVVAIIERRDGRYRAVSPARYAAGLHELAHSRDPDALVDALLIGAVIEARSCERFFSLIEHPGTRLDPVIAGFYASLLRSEARHFEDYLALARSAATTDVSARLEVFLTRDRELIESPDIELRFLSGPSPVVVPATAGSV